MVLYGGHLVRGPLWVSLQDMRLKYLSSIGFSSSQFSLRREPRYFLTREVWIEVARLRSSTYREVSTYAHPGNARRSFQPKYLFTAVT